VAVLAGHPPDREQRLGALEQRLADADQDAGGEGDADAAGVGEDPQAHRGFLVGGAVVAPAGLGPEALGGGFQHHAHARGDRPQPLQLVPGQDAGVEMRQQAGLFEDRDRARA
jgi:hypothetical protein